MYYGELNREDMKDLPENVKLDIYHFRLREDWDTPMDELLARYRSIVVDDRIYLTEEGAKHLDWCLKREDYVRNANNDYSFNLTRCVECLIKDGKILKNRHGHDYY
jgi:hypothetical protein